MLRRSLLRAPIVARRSLSTLPPPRTSTVESALGVGPFGNVGGESSVSRVSGSTAEGWEDVRAAFESNFADNLELDAQLSIYEKGVPVVELYGSAAHQSKNNYAGHTLQNIFSSGKNLEAIACMMLVDRGLMRYEDRVAEHWPAFGQHGKAHITVEDVLRHESGLQFFVDPAHPDDFRRTLVPTVADVAATSTGAVERIIESAGVWGHGRRMYHASTRGLVIGGLVRQLTGETLGQFIKTSIAEPLGIEVLCGTPLDEQARYEYAAMKSVGIGYTVRHEVLPALLGRGGNPETLAVRGAGMRSNLEPLEPPACDPSLCISVCRLAPLPVLLTHPADPSC